VFFGGGGGKIGLHGGVQVERTQDSPEEGVEGVTS